MELRGATGINLQATLSASSAGGAGPVNGKHHPITCTEELELDGEGFRCPHAEVGPDDERTQACLDHSVAILLIELAAASL